VTAAAAWGAAAVTLAVAACQRSDSTLLVEVTSTVALAPASLRATVSADRRSWTAGASGDPITLPAGLELGLPRDVVGPVTATVDAYDAAEGWLAAGTTVQAHIDAGGDTTIVVTLLDDEGAMESAVP
jgi:hypothetical protein